MSIGPLFGRRVTFGGLNGAPVSGICACWTARTRLLLGPPCVGGEVLGSRIRWVAILFIFRYRLNSAFQGRLTRISFSLHLLRRTDKGLRRRRKVGHFRKSKPWGSTEEELRKDRWWV